jgi:hypothetical protein
LGCAGPLGQAGPRKASVGWAGFKVEAGFGQWPYEREKNFYNLQTNLKSNPIQTLNDSYSQNKI